jgi:glucose dehydrogenase
VGPAIEWGSALNGDDGSAAYVPINNFLHQVYTVKGVPGGSPLTTNAGSWSSINIKTGAINWQIRTVGQDLANPTFPGASPGAMSFSNRVVFGSSSSGVFAAMDAYTGAVLWQYPTGLNVGGAPAIFNETVYWGAGVRAVGTTVPTLYAFAVPG